MALLEPPSRPYLSMVPGHTEPSSTRTSTTHIEMAEAESSIRIGEQRSPSHGHGPSSNKESTSSKESREDPYNGPDGSAAVSYDVQAPQTPQIFITFLVISGRRRTMSFEPETTLGRVKELVWNAWPAGAFNIILLA